MANGLIMGVDGHTVTAKNVSSTTAITAGDLVYAPTNNDVFQTTADVSSYSWDDVKVKTILCSATGYKSVIGVAMNDAGTSASNTSQVAVAMQGIFMHQAKAETGGAGNIEAGSAVQAAEATVNGLQVDGNATTEPDVCIGKALTGSSTSPEYVLWKLNL